MGRLVEVGPLVFDGAMNAAIVCAAGLLAVAFSCRIHARTPTRWAPRLRDVAPASARAVVRSVDEARADRDGLRGHAAAASEATA